MIVFGIAAAAHATAIFGPELLRSRPEKPRITQQVVHEEIRASEKQKKSDYSPLEEKRKQYLGELLSMLENGKRVLLSDFLIKSQVLDKNIELAEEKQQLIKESDVKEKYFQLVERAKKEVIGKGNKIEELHRFLHTKVFAGYFLDSGSILDVIDRGWYNCLSSTETFSALLEDVLGEERYKVVLFDDHVNTFLKGMVVENTSHTWKEAYKGYNGCGLVAPSDIFVAAYLVKHGISEEELPPHIAAIYKPKKVWKGCSKKGKNKMAKSLKGGGLPAPRVNSGLPEPPQEFIPNPHFELSPKRIVSLAKGLLAAYQLSHLHEERRFMKTRMNGKQMLVKPIQIPDDVNWGELLETFKHQLGFSTFLPFLPQKIHCCMPIYSINGSAIPEIIEILSARGDTRFDFYKKENICKRYKELLENGKMDEIRGYFSYNFCPELNELLKNRYLRERSTGLLWWGIADLALPENFDFFVSELNSEIPDIKEAAASGLIFSDTKRGCEVLKALPEKEKDVVNVQLGWCCRDIETAWRGIYNFKNSGGSEDYASGLEVALRITDGKDLSLEQYEVLKSIAEDIPMYLRLEYAQILYEYGDAEEAEAYVKGTVERVLKGESPTSFGLCSFPKEATPLIIPILKEKPEHAIDLANGLVCHGGGREHIPALVGPLRDIVFDGKMDLEMRVSAAFALLRLGVDPLKKEK